MDKFGTYIMEDDKEVRFNPDRKLTWTIDNNNYVWFNAPCSMSYDAFIKEGGEDIVLIFSV
jgi:hypothetical protein